MTDDDNPIDEAFADRTIVGDGAMVEEGKDGKTTVRYDVVGFDNNNPFSVTPIDDMKQAAHDQQAAEAAAIARMTDEQRALGWGSHWIRFISFHGHPLAIFGKTPTREEFAAREDPATVEQYDALLERGYIFSLCSSTVEPGELGTTHVSTIAAELGEDEYEFAKAWGWDPDELAERTDWFLDIAAGSHLS